MQYFLLESFYRDEAFYIQNRREHRPENCVAYNTKTREAVLLRNMMGDNLDPKIEKGLPTTEEEGLPS